MKHTTYEIATKFPLTILKFLFLAFMKINLSHKSVVLVLLSLLLGYNVQAQVLIGENRDPDIDAVLELASRDSLGLLLPRVELRDLVDAAPLQEFHAGMVVYNVGNDTVGVALPAGYYYSDGSQWIQITDSNLAPWKNITTNEAATSSSDSIYQMGPVLVGGAILANHTQFQVSSPTNGVLFPRMSTVNRDAIGPNDIPDGLTIYNTDTHCYNYYSGASGWVSLCGESDPAVFTMGDCAFADYAPQTPEAYKVGEPLTTDHTYKIKVRVERAGTYSILLSTGNGYSFSAAGEFTEIGIEPVITLVGSGVPLRKGTDDTFTLRFNGQVVDHGCTLNGIEVAGTGAEYTFSCTSIPVTGSYQKGKAVSPTTHYVEIQLTGTQTGSGVIIEATPLGQNGLIFRSNPIDVAPGVSQTVRLLASGTPAAIGSYTYTITADPTSGGSCNFPVLVSSNIGTFENPAKSCLAIYNELGLNSTTATTHDGEYYIQQSSGSRNAVKTYCDMTNGGYTLIWSFSEGTAYAGRRTGGNSTLYLPAGEVGMNTQHHLWRNFPSRVITSNTTDTIDMRDYRLALSTMQNVKSSSVGNYRVMISYDVKKLMTDYWARNFYMYVTPPSGSDFINGGYSGRSFRNFQGEGKIFGKVFTTGGGSSSFAGLQVTDGPNNWWNATYRATHIDFGHSFEAGRLRHFTARTGIDPLYQIDGTPYTYTFDTHGFNNMFGWFRETTGDHQFGKCYSWGNDYTNNEDGNGCSSSDKRPHSFNNNEGRYLSWWVK